jgi:hypothetical protein
MKTSDRCVLLFRTILLGVACSLTLVSFTSHAQAQSLLDVVVSPEPPADEAEDPDFPGGNPIDFFDAYSWKLFIALNWPAKANKRGIPDKTKDISDVTAPRVWETWKSISDIYLPDGDAPSDWDAPVTASPNEKVLPFAMVGPVLEEFNQVDAAGFPVGHLVARNRTYVRYEIRVNQKQFDNIRDKKLYLRETLEKAQSNGTPIVFDNQSIEIKAAWRELKSPEDDGQKDRYYHVRARAVDPETNTTEVKDFALIGFHIGQKTATRRQWTWSTFEHVDMLEVGANSPPGTLASLQLALNDEAATPPTGGINAQNPPKPDPDPTLVRRFIFNDTINTVSRPATDKTNRKWQEHEKIKNTVWKNYRLVLTQWPTIKNQETGLGAPFPSKNVANVTMETFIGLQKSSCIQCHFPTAFSTDFAWFVSLRAFPIPPAEGALPGGNVPGAVKAKDFAKRLQRARERALVEEPEPIFNK